MPKPIGIAADHAGYELKEILKPLLAELGFDAIDFGTHSTASMDYPDVIHPLCKDLTDGKFSIGIIICGSGNGVNITANKYSGIRSALCWAPELAALARQHNNANVLAIPARFIAVDDAKECVRLFLSTAFEGGRHQTRVDKIPRC
ncbi:MAG: ribose 5-phosphate isomerase B [Bacteroidia bacterium]|nr:ribose 5-phosphate isomerase B [Bacteroidia bacterium]